MPEIRTQDVTYTIEQPRFATTGANKGEIAFELAISSDCLYAAAIEAGIIPK